MTLLCGQNSNLLILLHRRTVFKMLALEQLTGKWPFSAGGSFDCPDPLGYRPSRTYDDTFSRIDTIPKRDRRTDGQFLYQYRAREHCCADGM